ncbi:hypothetical protein JK188_01820 [Providencia sp. JGM181]|uniref:hypothetical protein n=1 Tax=unclassified Providencia TaxID=2633465 RepID=UPI001BA4D03A|nr:MULTISPECIES: hypothetical protein [unclassified Providencia]MBS0923214.1 hypothetical protein [Providencia sp. JGM181]MBS0931987.1 hypothetical protein [Providencia sp. JGM172]MBS0996180.1 hypothetical protein [Providencia sp. JGM178]
MGLLLGSIAVVIFTVIVYLVIYTLNEVDNIFTNSIAVGVVFILVVLSCASLTKFYENKDTSNCNTNNKIEVIHGE